MKLYLAVDRASIYYAQSDREWMVKEVEMTEEQLADYERVMDEFDRIQDWLHSLPDISDA